MVQRNFIKKCSGYIAFIVCFFLLTGCAAGSKENEDWKGFDINPYEEVDLDNYLTLPDYDGYSFDKVEYSVSEQEINDEIAKRLLEAGNTETVTEGVVKTGDKITIQFSPSESEADNLDGLSSEEMQIVLGKEDMVDGFQEGIVGKKIGEAFTLNITFPDPYPVKQEIAGETINFDIMVKNKIVTLPATLNEAFLKANGSAKTEQEYKKMVRAEMEKDAYETALQDVKDTFYEQIIGNVVMKDMPQDKVQEFKEILDSRYRRVAEEYEIEWEDFLVQYFSVTPDDYDAYLLSYAREVIKQEMVLYAIAEREGIQLTEDDYNDFLNMQLKNSGYEDAKAFEESSGISIHDYVVQNRLFINYLLNKDMEVIYERLNG